MSNKIYYYIFIIALLVVSRYLELLTTYWLTPDLAMEMNPLVGATGRRWSILLTLNALACIVLTISVYQYFFTYKTSTVPMGEYQNYKEYISDLYYGQKNRFNWFWKGKIPNNKAAYFYHLSYGVTIALIGIGFFLSMHNYLCINPNNTYTWLVSKTPIGAAYVYIIVIVIFIVSIHYALRNDYLSRLSI